MLEKYKRGCTEMQVLSEVALRFNLNDSEAVHMRTEVAWRDTSIKKVDLLHLAAWVLKWCSYFLCLADDQPKYCDLPISSYSTADRQPFVADHDHGDDEDEVADVSPYDPILQKKWYFC